ncbi:MAG: ribonuclease III domain-containing protein [Frisingicoccus sp.]
MQPHELVIRSLLWSRNAPVNKLHKRSSRLVKAQAQAEAAVKLLDVFTEEELAVYKREDARSHTMAKNAEMTDYRMATGFEAVMGYLHLKQDYERMVTLIHMELAIS